jgi:nucleoside-diphosphate-sugar epimerase
MKIWIMGSKGVIGSELLSYLRKQRYGRNTKNRVTGADVNYSNIETTQLATIFSAYEPDVIYHFAQVSRVPISVQYPYHTYINNVQSILNVIEAIRLSKHKPFLIFASSREVYGRISDEVTHVPPSYRREALNPYAASKIASETLIEAYANAYNIRSIICRLSSVYGSLRDHPSRLIPRLILQALVKKTITLYPYDDKKVFDFVYIDDVVKSLEYLLNAINTVSDLSPLLTFQLTTGYGTTVKQVATIIASETGAKIEVQESPERPLHIDQTRFIGTESLPIANPTPIHKGLRATVLQYQKLSKARLLQLYKESLDYTHYLEHMKFEESIDG